MKDTKNFKSYEFQCKCGCRVEKMTQDHIDRLQKFRDWYKRPMAVCSGYRCAKHNRAVGGAKQSQHLFGTASDISFPAEFYGFSKERKEQFLNNIKNKWYELGGGGVGFYNTFFHLDSRKNIAFWDERSNK